MWYLHTKYEWREIRPEAKQSPTDTAFINPAIPCTWPCTWRVYLSHVRRLFGQRRPEWERGRSQVWAGGARGKQILKSLRPCCTRDHSKILPHATRVSETPNENTAGTFHQSYARCAEPPQRTETREMVAPLQNEGRYREERKKLLQPLSVCFRCATKSDHFYLFIIFCANEGTD